MLFCWKALNKRIGHADVAFTMKQYAQTDLEAGVTDAVVLPAEDGRRRKS